MHGSRELLAASWEAILTSHLAEAAEHRPSAPPSIEEATAFLAEAVATPGLPFSGVGLGTERHVRGGRFTGSTVHVDDTLVHGSWFVLAA